MIVPRSGGDDAFSSFMFDHLTCSCNSAKRCCLSFSESALEHSDSEELELSSDTAGGGTCRVEGAGRRADDGVGTGTVSSGSSGILAKRISNTSCQSNDKKNLISLKLLLIYILIKTMHFHCLNISDTSCTKCGDKEGTSGHFRIFSVYFSCVKN